MSLLNNILTFQARAKQLYEKGIKTVKDVACIPPDDLAKEVRGMNLDTAKRVISSAQCLVHLKAADLLDDAAQLKNPHQCQPLA